MLTDLENLKFNLNKLIGNPISHIRFGYGSSFFISFGKLREKTIHSKFGEKKVLRGEWEFFIDMAEWEFTRDKKTLINSEESEEKMKWFFDHELMGKKWLGCAITSEDFHTIVNFEGGIDLIITPNNDEEDYEQWTLFTLDGYCYTAGPGNEITIETNQE